MTILFSTSTDARDASPDAIFEIADICANSILKFKQMLGNTTTKIFDLVFEEHYNDRIGLYDFLQQISNKNNPTHNKNHTRDKDLIALLDLAEFYWQQTAHQAYDWRNFTKDIFHLWKQDCHGQQAPTTNTPTTIDKPSAPLVTHSNHKSNDNKNTLITEININTTVTCIDSNPPTVTPDIPNTVKPHVNPSPVGSINIKIVNCDSNFNKEHDPEINTNNTLVHNPTNRQILDPSNNIAVFSTISPTLDNAHQCNNNNFAITTSNYCVDTKTHILPPTHAMSPPVATAPITPSLTITAINDVTHPITHPYVTATDHNPGTNENHTLISPTCVPAMDYNSGINIKNTLISSTQINVVPPVHPIANKPHHNSPPNDLPTMIHQPILHSDSYSIDNDHTRDIGNKNESENNNIRLVIGTNYTQLIDPIDHIAVIPTIFPAIATLNNDNVPHHHIDTLTLISPSISFHPHLSPYVLSPCHHPDPPSLPTVAPSRDHIRHHLGPNNDYVTTLHYPLVNHTTLPDLHPVKFRTNTTISLTRNNPHTIKFDPPSTQMLSLPIAAPNIVPFIHTADPPARYSNMLDNIPTYNKLTIDTNNCSPALTTIIHIFLHSPANNHHNGLIAIVSSRSTPQPILLTLCHATIYDKPPIRTSDHTTPPVPSLAAANQQTNSTVAIFNWYNQQANMLAIISSFIQSLSFLIKLPTSIPFITPEIMSLNPFTNFDFVRKQIADGKGTDRMMTEEQLPTNIFFDTAPAPGSSALSTGTFITSSPLLAPTNGLTVNVPSASPSERPTNPFPAPAPSPSPSSSPLVVTPSPTKNPTMSSMTATPTPDPTGSTNAPMDSPSPSLIPVFEGFPSSPTKSPQPSPDLFHQINKNSSDQYIVTCTNTCIATQYPSTPQTNHRSPISPLSNEQDYDSYHCSHFSPPIDPLFESSFSHLSTHSLILLTTPPFTTHIQSIMFYINKIPHFPAFSTAKLTPSLTRSFHPTITTQKCNSTPFNLSSINECLNNDMPILSWIDCPTGHLPTPQSQPGLHHIDTASHINSHRDTFYTVICDATMTMRSHSIYHSTNDSIGTTHSPDWTLHHTGNTVAIHHNSSSDLMARILHGATHCIPSFKQATHPLSAITYDHNKIFNSNHFDPSSTHSHQLILHEIDILFLTNYIKFRQRLARQNTFASTHFIATNDKISFHSLWATSPYNNTPQNIHLALHQPQTSLTNNYQIPPIATQQHASTSYDTIPSPHNLIDHHPHTSTIHNCTSVITIHTPNKTQSSEIIAMAHLSRWYSTLLNHVLSFNSFDHTASHPQHKTIYDDIFYVSRSQSSAPSLIFTGRDIIQLFVPKPTPYMPPISCTGAYHAKEASTHNHIFSINNISSTTSYHYSPNTFSPLRIQPLCA